jgi:chlorophyll(ide) b reductase
MLRPPSLLLGRAPSASSVAAAQAKAPAVRPTVVARALRPVPSGPPSANAAAADVAPRCRVRRRWPAARAGAADADSSAATATTPITPTTTTAAPAAPSYGVVVTGGSKGIGYALALEFLRSGDRVVVCARDGGQVERAALELERAAGLPSGSGRVHGVAADVSKPDDVRALAAFAKQRLGSVSIWINNAGTNAYRYGPLLDSDDATLARIVETNVLGVLLCCREAVRLMRDQPGGGHIFNMDGAGADGSATPRFAAYGATKRSLAQLGASVRAELKLAGISGVGIHDVSPGMVATELLLSGARDTPAARFFVNALAEEASDVAAFLVPRVREVPERAAGGGGGVAGGGGGGGTGGQGDSDGGRRAASPAGFLRAAAAGGGGGVPSPVYIRFLTRPKALAKIFSRLITGARKGRFVEED